MITKKKTSTIPIRNDGIDAATIINGTVLVRLPRKALGNAGQASKAPNRVPIAKEMAVAVTSSPTDQGRVILSMVVTSAGKCEAD